MIKLKKYSASLLLIVLIPQLVNLLCCWMLSGRQLHEIPAAVYIGDNTAFSRHIVKAFDNHDTFDILHYAATPEEVPELIRQGKAAFGLIIPKHFTEDIMDGKSPNLLTVVDGSQLSAASFTKIAASEILLELKSEMLRDTLRERFSMTGRQAENAAAALVFQNRLLGNPTRNYLNFLMPGMMTAVVQVGLAMAAAASVEREPRKTLLSYLASKTAVFTGLGFVSLMTVIGIQTVFFKVPMRSGLLPVVPLTLLFAFAVASMGIMLSTLFWNKVLASQAAAIWFIPSTILSGYTWPLSSMPGAYQSIAWFMPFTHYGDTLRDLLLKGEAGHLTGQMVFLFAAGMAALTMGVAIETVREKLSERRKPHVNPA